MCDAHSTSPSCKKGRLYYHVPEKKYRISCKEHCNLLLSSLTEVKNIDVLNFYLNRIHRKTYIKHGKNICTRIMELKLFPNNSDSIQEESDKLYQQVLEQRFSSSSLSSSSNSFLNDEEEDDEDEDDEDDYDYDKEEEKDKKEEEKLCSIELAVATSRPLRIKKPVMKYDNSSYFGSYAYDPNHDGEDDDSSENDEEEEEEEERKSSSSSSYPEHKARDNKTKAECNRLFAERAVKASFIHPSSFILYLDGPQGYTTQELIKQGVPQTVSLILPNHDENHFSSRISLKYCKMTECLRNLKTNQSVSAIWLDYEDTLDGTGKEKQHNFQDIRQLFESQTLFTGSVFAITLTYRGYLTSFRGQAKSEAMAFIERESRMVGLKLLLDTCYEYGTMFFFLYLVEKQDILSTKYSKDNKDNKEDKKTTRSHIDDDFSSENFSKNMEKAKQLVKQGLEMQMKGYNIINSLLKQESTPVRKRKCDKKWPTSSRGMKRNTRKFKKSKTLKT